MRKRLRNNGLTNVPPPALGLAGLAIALSVSPACHAGSAPENESGRFADGQFGLGSGSSYDYDGTRATALVVTSWTWADDRYECVAIRFLSSQVKRGTVLAGPNWAFQIQRRWSLVHSSAGRLFFGGGAAYKTETDDINGSRLNFAEEILWRFPSFHSGGEFQMALRHMSNAGIKKPNKGQDFVTVVYAF